MSTSTYMVPPSALKLVGHNTTGGTLQLRGSHVEPDTSAYPELDVKGYTVVPGVLSRDRAEEHVDAAFAWLESFGTGFNRNDRSTWKKDLLPAFNAGGLFNRHGVQQEQWTWDVRSEPALIDVFADVWGTHELLVSFDAANISLPFDKDEDIYRKAWPHVDQSPRRRFKHCVQGIMNLRDVGPKDGSLMVLEGSFELYDTFFQAHAHEEPTDGWSWKDSFTHTPEHISWFLERGCKWIKVEAKAGDVILWDSRVIHYGAPAEGDNVRVATYVCFKPAAKILPDGAAFRKECFEQGLGTSHDPLIPRWTGAKAFGLLSPDERERPVQAPILSHRAQQLAGLVPY